MTTHELLPAAPRRHRIFGGLTERQERIFTGIAAAVIAAFLVVWVGAFREAIDQHREIARQQAAIGIEGPAPAASPTQQITSSLLHGGTRTAYITDAMMSFLSPLRGRSGSLLFTTREPGAPIVKGAPSEARSVLSGGGAQTASNFVTPPNPGLYNLAIQMQQATRPLDNFTLITLVPFTQKRGGKIGLYYLGTWPFEKGGRPKTPAYANPAGFIRVTPQNENTRVSEHFQLRDFLTHNQQDVWPKYLLLDPKLVDKLELTIQQLEKMGHPVRHMTIMSGFRTPSYNVGGGNTEGRANLSRHMYGDASDVFIDDDGNGRMDDLNGDGRVDSRDAEVLQQAAERVEAANPSLVGGVGVYSACCGHGPFVHIDTRGYRARWRGFGNG